jgi:hypothetical protein
LLVSEFLSVMFFDSRVAHSVTTYAVSPFTLYKNKKPSLESLVSVIDLYLINQGTISERRDQPSDPKCYHVTSKRSDEVQYIE